MKSDMDYKEKYEQALQRAKQFSEKPFLEDSKGIVEYIFPELKESEDDKTKRILHSISSKISFHLRDIFTEEEFQCFDTWSNSWLEKQGEQKPAEWSEEDNVNLNYIIKVLGRLYERNDKAYLQESLERKIKWLKSLRPQSHWKPSDEQMDALDDVISSRDIKYDVLSELWKDLKKLKG